MLVGKRKKQIERDNKWIFGTMLIGAILSLLASFVLSIQSLELAKNPDADLACSINIVLNCSTVALHDAANLLGFPNSFLGIMAESIVITVAIAGLMGVVFPRKFMFIAQLGYAAGFIFAIYLLYMSVNVIGALCPWCLVVTVTTTFVFFSITRYNIRENNLYLPENLQKKLVGYIEKDYDRVLTILIVVGIAAIIIAKYGSELF